LIRNKLDKYYRDLTTANINDWLAGFGDLPDSLTKFCLTLPHWKDGEDPPASFVDMRMQSDQVDLATLKSKGASEKWGSTIGFCNFAAFMERKIEQMFSGAVGPIMKKLKDLKGETVEKKITLTQEMESTDPSQMLSTLRDCGVSFGHALNHVLEGYVRSDSGRLTLEDELRLFHAQHDALGTDTFDRLPSEDFSCLDDYIEYLRNEMKLPAYDVEINGGAMFRRLMVEIEVFLRFSEICMETRKRDVIQARGVSNGQLDWRDVVVKLLSNEAHIPMKRKVRYAGERIKFFFQCQKEPILHFMGNIKGSSDEKNFSALFTKHVKLIESNETIKNRIFHTYDTTVDRQLGQFMDLFSNTIASTFANPWVFLKRSSYDLKDEGLGEVCLPSFEDTKQRIPIEVDGRCGIEKLLTQWLLEVPQEATQIDEAVDRVQMLILKTFSFIRSQICDQIELFGESFFKLPMMRRLEDDMSRMELSEVDQETHMVKRDILEQEYNETTEFHREVEECINKLQGFALKVQARSK